jgi:hypothetical protein
VCLRPQRRPALTDVIMPDVEADIAEEKAHALFQLLYGLAYAHFEHDSREVENIVAAVPCANFLASGGRHGI